MWEKIKLRAYGVCVEVEIRRGNLIMICDGSYQTNMDDNILVSTW